jgi:hypothetical protein
LFGNATMIATNQKFSILSVPWKFNYLKG